MKFDHVVLLARHNNWHNRLVNGLFIIILAWIWSGCTLTRTPTLPIPSTINGLLPEDHLSEGTVQQLFLIAGEYLTQSENHEIIEFMCTITEGTFCWFAEEDLGGALYGHISRDLARTIVDELDASVIDQAKNNEVQIRCMKTVGADSPLTCEGNWGWNDEWISIPIK